MSLSLVCSGTNILVRSSASRGVDDRNRFDEVPSSPPSPLSLFAHLCLTPSSHTTHQIPAGIDVLVSHGAAYGKLDFADLRGCEHGHSHSHSHSHSHGYSESSLRPRSDADTPGLARKVSHPRLSLTHISLSPPPTLHTASLHLTAPRAHPRLSLAHPDTSQGSRELLHAIKRIRPGLHLHGLAAEARGVMYPQVRASPIIQAPI